MKIGVLTSSRADYGIYLPLLQKMKVDDRFQLEIIAFGMHLQKGQGYTIDEISNNEYQVIHKVGKMPEGDSILEISKGYGEHVLAFANFWNSNKFDLVFALGDRWEMSAAVQASIPFELKIAHIHGGETSLGSTDNIYRDQISLVSKYHFTATEEFSKRVISIINSKNGVHTVGSISLEGLNLDELPQWQSIKEEFSIPFDDFILFTFHPESVGVKKNIEYSKILFKTIKELSDKYNVLITRSNSDVLGSQYNYQFKVLEDLLPDKIKLVSSLGKLNYFRALERCHFMLGNTSSGIIEAASFKKWVINIGDRQKGRLRNQNTIDVPLNAAEIHQAISTISSIGVPNGYNKYVRSLTTDNIIRIITEE